MDATVNVPPNDATRQDGFRHEALFYRGIEEFRAGVTRFLADGLASGEPALVVVANDKAEALRSALNDNQDGVEFADMDRVGRNPARVIAVWHDFLRRRGTSRPVRGVGEPISPRSGGAHAAEMQVHEALLNVAFADGPAWRLLCPYDASALSPAVIDEARHSHPLVTDTRGASTRSPSYGATRPPEAALAGSLPLPPPSAGRLEFTNRPLHHVRATVADHAAAAGLRPDRAADFVLAVDEVAANSLRHGAGRKVLYLWRERGKVLAEVRDGGRITDPLVGRREPDSVLETSRGLWIVNQVCDLVQIRSDHRGTVVRLHMALGDTAA